MKERPKCRKVVEELIRKGYSLSELANPCDAAMEIWRERGLIPVIIGTIGLSLQIRKMLGEENGN